MAHFGGLALVGAEPVEQGSPCARCACDGEARRPRTHPGIAKDDVESAEHGVVHRDGCCDTEDDGDQVMEPSHSGDDVLEQVDDFPECKAQQYDDGEVMHCFPTS